MSTTVEKLQKVLNTKNALKEKINEKGGNITDNTPFADYVGELDNIGGSGDNTTLLKLLDRTITEIVIPNEVTTIGKYTFAECRNLKNITFHNNVTTIDTYAFIYCKGLTSLILPNSIGYIGAAAFQLCECLTSIVLPKNNNLTRIIQATFANCSSLTNLTIPSSVTSIEKQALLIGSTTNKATITFEGTTPPTIVTGAFDTNKLEAIRVPMSAVDTYKSATNWSAFADYIVGY